MRDHARRSGHVSERSVRSSPRVEPPFGDAQGAVSEVEPRKPTSASGGFPAQRAGGGPCTLVAVRERLEGRAVNTAPERRQARRRPP